MGRVRRWAITPILALLISALAAVTSPLASASTAPAPGMDAASPHKPPVLAGIERAALHYTAGALPVRVTAALTVRSPASATLKGATVRISAGFTAGQDSLAFAKRSGITGSFKASSGVLTLKGSAPTVSYQAALRSVTYRDSNAKAPAGTRKISFQVSDGEPDHPLSNVVSRTVLVARSKQLTVVNQSYRAVGNTPLGVGTTPPGPAATVSGSVLKGASDPDPTATLSVTANTTPAHGSVIMRPNGTFTYRPNPGYSGTDSFQCTIAGSNAPSQTATATVTITVAAVVWYVNDSDQAAGNGEAASPFNTLAAANTAARANSIIFLYQGNAAYTSGVTMQPHEDLYGQPHGLTVGGYSLVPPGGSAPAISNGSEDGSTWPRVPTWRASTSSTPAGPGSRPMKSTTRPSALPIRSRYRGRTTSESRSTAATAL